MARPSIDILTATCRPELVEHVRWMFARQETEAEIRHHVLLEEPQPDGRMKGLAKLLPKVTGDFYMLADDDDYVAPCYVQRCLENIGSDRYYGEIPRRSYLMSGAYGVSEERKRVFQSFTLRRADRLGIDTPDVTGPHTDDLILIRGLLRDPSTAGMPHKAVYSPEHWPHVDRGFEVLRQWLADDMEAFERYLAIAIDNSWPA